MDTMLFAEASGGGITWTEVAMAAISAVLTIVPMVIALITAYLSLKSKLADNTAKTEAAARSANAAVVRVEEMAATTKEIHAMVNGKYAAVSEELTESRKQLTNLLKAKTTESMEPVIKKKKFGVVVDMVDNDIDKLT